jgi:lysophospholipase L1-like esterase
LGLTRHHSEGIALARASELVRFGRSVSPLLAAIFIVCAAGPGVSVEANPTHAAGARAAATMPPALDPDRVADLIEAAVPALAAPAPSLIVPVPSTPAALFAAPTGSPLPSIAAGEPRSFVALGDSLSVWSFTPGSRRLIRAGAWPYLLAALDPDLRLVHNAGVIGNNTSQMLGRLSRDVFAYHPDVLFVLGGTNDVGENFAVSTTVGNVRKIVRAAKARGIEVVLMTLPPSNSTSTSQLKRLRQTNAALIALGRAEGITVVDVYAALVTSSGRLIRADAATDGLHLNVRGEQVIAQTVFAAVTAPASPLPSATPLPSP